MSTGHLFLLISMPRDWPTTDSIVVQQTRDVELISIFATPDNRLRFEVKRNSDVVVAWLSHPLSIEGEGLAILEVSWDEGSVTMHVGGNQVSNVPPTEPPVTVVLKGFVAEPSVSLNDPEATESCKKWVEWRAKRYSRPKPAPREGHRLKTTAEQLAELARARAGLVELVRLLMGGRTQMIGHVATDLRALLHWNGAHYRPLLLRMAARFSLPLPIYYVPAPEPPAVIRSARTHLTNHGASIIRQLGAHRLTDLQEWLTSEVFSLNSTGSPQGAARPRSILSVIHSTSSTLGTAHYDEDLSLDLEAMYNIRGPQTDELTRLIASAASVTIPLCQYVLLAAEQRIAAA